MTADPEFWEYDRDGLILEIKSGRDRLEDMRACYANASAQAGGLHVAIKEWATAESTPWDTIRRANAERNLLQVYHRTQDDWLTIFTQDANKVIEAWKEQALHQQEIGNDHEAELIEARELLTVAAAAMKWGIQAMEGNLIALKMGVNTPCMVSLRNAYDVVGRWLIHQKAKRGIVS